MASRYGSNYGVPVGRAVIQQLGGKVTPEKLKFFEAWARAEGTKAGYNPFATTRKGYAGETQFNSVGVKNYPDLQTGIKATVDTLNLDYYTHIVKLLKDPNTTAQQLGSAVAASPWGTGTGVLRVLGVHAVEGYEQAQSTAKYGEKKASLEATYQTITTSRFAPSQSYQDMLERTRSPLADTVGRWRPLEKTVMTPGLPDEDLSTPPGFDEAGSTPGYTGGFQGKVWVSPTTWSVTHPTDDLGGTGWTGAHDFMLDAGTPVGAPESGIVIAWDAQGAQGGGRIRFRSDSGYEYWMGHIDNGLAVGTRVKRGQPIAVISNDHAAPHLHIDRRRVGKPKSKLKPKPKLKKAA